MLDPTLNHDIQTLHKTYNEIDNQFDEVHNNLSYNIEKFKMKKERINSYSTHKINTCLKMIKREKQLTMYANSLISKQKIINNKKKLLQKQIDVETKTLDEEIERANIQLQAIYKIKRQLLNKKQDLQIEHEILSSKIRNTTSALEETSLREIEKNTFFNKSQTLKIIEESNSKLTSKIEKRNNKIQIICESTIFLNKSIIQLKIALQNAQISNQSIKAKILVSQTRLNKVQNDINEFRNEIHNKQKYISDQTLKLKEEESKLANYKNTAQIHCESIRHEINAIKISTNEVKKLINDKTVDISLKNDQINEIKVTIINLKEGKESALDNSIIKTDQLKKSTDRIIELNNNIQSITQQRDETKSLFIKENLNIQEMKKIEENSIPLVKECIQLFNKIDNEINIENSLIKLSKEIENKSKQKLPSFNNDQEVKLSKDQHLQIIKSLDNEIQIENSNQKKLLQYIKSQQKKNIYFQQMKKEIESQIKQTKIFNDPILLSINSEPNIENVKLLIESLKLKREKRISRKTRDNETLQKRLNELTKSINIRKRKMKRQINSIVKERDELDILPDEDRVVFKSIESLYEIASKEILLWNNSEESEKLLNSWVKKMEDLYNKLDEFILRK